MEKYDFDTLADRQIDNARKWDKKIVEVKFPNVREDFIPLWIADMDFQSAPEIRAALTKMASNEMTNAWLIPGPRFWAFQAALKIMKAIIANVSHKLLTRKIYFSR